MDEFGEDTTMRFTENGVTFHAVMWRNADTDHTRHIVATDAGGRYIGSCYPTDLIRQTGWFVTIADALAPVPVPDEPRAVIYLINRSGT